MNVSRTALSLVLGLSWAAWAFQIDGKKPVHEMVTAQALECARMAGDSEPTRRAAVPAHAMDNGYLQAQSLDLPVFKVEKVSIKELGRAVRWPDDPTREVGLVSLVKFALKMLGTCKDYSNDINTGLLCNSRHGSLQFFHAMASSQSETTAETQARILDWVTFLYGVVSGEIDIAEDYCLYFSTHASKISGALLPKDFFGCKTKDPWTLGTLFSLHLPNFGLR